MAKKDYMTDSQVEVEIERLLNSEHVRLAKAEERMRYRRRQYMYQLRTYERKGKELAKAGVTMENLEEILNGGNEDYGC